MLEMWLSGQSKYSKSRFYCLIRMVKSPFRETWMSKLKYLPTEVESSENLWLCLVPLLLCPKSNKRLREMMSGCWSRGSSSNKQIKERQETSPCSWRPWLRFYLTNCTALLRKIHPETDQLYVTALGTRHNYLENKKYSPHFPDDLILKNSVN